VTRDDFKKDRFRALSAPDIFQEPVFSSLKTRYFGCF